MPASNTTNVSAVVDPVFMFGIAGHAGACNGATQSLDATSAATTVALGHVTSSASKIGAQDLTAGTNSAQGYTVYIRSTGAMSDGNGHTIADLAGATNLSPTAFASAGTAALGYTTNDATLGTGTANRFTNAGPKWAALNGTSAEVLYEPASAQTTACVGYQVGVSAVTPAGAYATSVVYTALPSF